MYAIDRGEAKL